MEVLGKLTKKEMDAMLEAEHKNRNLRRLL
jgi:hypothetical protein